MRLFDAVSILLLALSTLVSSLNTTVPHIRGTTSHFAKLRNNTYHYLAAQPAVETESKGTILLFHGLPDFSYGWRYQIPFLSSLGYHVVAPDMLGYADTDLPCDISYFAMKELSADMAELVSQLVPHGHQVIVGGHDWGAGLAYKFAMWHPELVKSFFYCRGSLRTVLDGPIN